ncbi:MAG: hypothetical protein JNM68_03905 [Dinghuibacter sp.]|nr:hypothetical protein [Dinghuibacter sp.]
MKTINKKIFLIGADTPAGLSLLARLQGEPVAITAVINQPKEISGYAMGVHRVIGVTRNSAINWAEELDGHDIVICCRGSQTGFHGSDTGCPEPLFTEIMKAYYSMNIHSFLYITSEIAAGERLSFLEPGETGLGNAV